MFKNEDDYCHPGHIVCSKTSKLEAIIEMYRFSIQTAYGSNLAHQPFMFAPWSASKYIETYREIVAWLSMVHQEI